MKRNIDGHVNGLNNNTKYAESIFFSTIATIPEVHIIITTQRRVGALQSKLCPPSLE